MNETPPFWFQEKSVQAALLSPISYLYGWISGRRMLREPSYHASIPAICVGNFIAGGAGKTPTAIAIAAIAKKQGRKPVFLTRGYGGGITAPEFVNLRKHNAHDVGDEALLLARTAPTLVAADRVLGAQKIEAAGKYDLIIMDDGLQNPRLSREINLVVVDGRRGVGNGYTHPGGPLRALLSRQFRRTDHLLVIGDGDAGSQILRQAARRGIPTHIAILEPGLKTKLRGKKVLAFAGIGDPEKFYATLRDMNVDVVSTTDFADHHFIHADEASALLEEAQKAGLQLVTTEKDYVRFSDHHAHGDEPSAIECLKDESLAVPVKLKLDNPASFEPIIKMAVERHRETQLKLNRS